MTTLSFDTGYASFQSDSALFGRRVQAPQLLARLGRLAATRPAAAVADVAARGALALLPFSAIVWLFVVR